MVTHSYLNYLWCNLQKCKNEDHRQDPHENSLSIKEDNEEKESNEMNNKNQRVSQWKDDEDRIANFFITTNPKYHHIKLPSTIKIENCYPGEVPLWEKRSFPRAARIHKKKKMLILIDTSYLNWCCTMALLMKMILVQTMIRYAPSCTLIMNKISITLCKGNWRSLSNCRRCNERKSNSKHWNR